MLLFISKILRNKVIRYAYLGWFVIALFYFYQYILRVAPGIMVDEIRYAFNITAEQFASLGALYLLAYASLQIPLGIIVDKIGVKKMCLYSLAAASIGAIIMGSTEVFWVMQFSRFIIGAGSAAAFMCAIKFIADHIPPGNRGLLMGATLALGIGGAILSGRCVKYLDAMFSWREVIVLSASLGIVVFILIMTFVKGAKEDKGISLNTKSFSENMKDVLVILSNKRVLVYAILAIGLYTPLAAIADLWGVAFLKQKFGLQKNEAASLVMTLYVGLTVGSLVLPWLTERYNILNRAIGFCTIALLVGFCILLYAPITGEFMVISLLFVIGFFCGAEMMCFTGALIGSHPNDSGQIIGVVNTLNMIGGALIQQLVGTLLDNQWQGVVDDFGVRQYNIHQFEYALSSLTVLIALCCVCSMVLVISNKKRYAHSYTKTHM